LKQNKPAPPPACAVLVGA